MPSANDNLFTVRLPPGMKAAIKASKLDQTQIVIDAFNAALGTDFKSRPKGGQPKPAEPPAKRPAAKRRSPARS